MNGYCYQGSCPSTGQILSLPRTPAAEQAAHQLMESLDRGAEGKMYGVLLVDTARGVEVLKAFSGLGPHPPGWVPPIDCQPASPLEQTTLLQLSQLKEQLRQLMEAPETAELEAALAHWQEAHSQLREAHRQAKTQRDRQRQVAELTAQLDQESRTQARELRLFKRSRQEQLGPLERRVEQIQQQILHCKHQRRELSSTLQAELHARLDRSIFPGQPWSLASLFPAGPPTGTGECCAPKLLHYAAHHGLRPLAMAEFWFGEPPPGGGRQAGQFYAACSERCQPLIGPLLSSARPELRILYEDSDLIAVDKPPGVLAVPGRHSWNQDSLLTRLALIYPEIRPVHRLDLETSGVILFARHRTSQAHLQRQLEARQVKKIYHALLDFCPSRSEGEVQLALAPDPHRPGCYRPDPDGKTAFTSYLVLDRATARVQLQPHTGRSHQLRVHAAWALASPIRGDRLYGPSLSPGRLHLHAQRLELMHPLRHGPLVLEAPLPF